MGLLKKIGLGLILVLAITGLLFLRFYAFYHTENLDIYVNASSEPAGEMRRVSLGGEVGFFPSSLVIEVHVEVRNRNPSRIRVDEAEYLISYGGDGIASGVLHGISLPSGTTTSLPLIQAQLDMDEITRNKAEMIQEARMGYGEAGFKISVALRTPALFLGVLRIGTAETYKERTVDLDLMQVLRVSSFRWKSGEQFVSECHPGMDLTGEFRLSKTGEPSGMEGLEAEIIQISMDMEQLPLDILTIEGTPTHQYSSFTLKWHVPDLPPMTCIGYSIRLRYGGFEVWSSTLETPSIPLIRRYTLYEALNDDDAFTITLRGKGYCSGDAIKLELKAEMDVTAEVEIEPGTVLINSGSGQNMIIAETRTIKLEPGVELEITLEAYCLDLHRDNPNSTEVFNIQPRSAGYSIDASRLMQSLSNVDWEHKSVSGIQLALWALVENPARATVEEVFHVSESALEDAAWLLTNIGINPDQTNLFKDG